MKVEKFVKVFDDGLPVPSVHIKKAVSIIESQRKALCAIMDQIDDRFKFAHEKVNAIGKIARKELGRKV